MALKDHARRSFQIKYLRCYLAPRLVTSEYGPWVDVSKYVAESNFGVYKRSIDSNDFDIGFYEESNVSIGFDNADALFMEGFGFFDAAIVDRSKLRIVAGYHDIEAPNDTSRIEYETTFEGIINDEGTRIDTTNEVATFTVLSYAGIINSLRADPGAVTNGQNFSTAIYNLLNRTEITSLLTLDLSNISPKVNESVEDASWFSGKQLKQAVNGLLLASNSIMKIVNNTIYISGRSESSTVRFQFYAKGSTQPANVIDMRGYSNGLRRVITRASVNGVTRDAQDDLIDLYGAHLKTLDLGFITSQATNSAIAQDLVNEFQYPKPELELTTDFLGNEIDLLDMVTIDNEGTILDESPALYGRAVYGTGTYVKRQTGVKLRPVEGFKVLGVTHDFRQYTTTLKLRSIGSQPYDGNAGYSNNIYGQATYGESKFAVL